jgi:hypothetical protein
LEQGIYALYIYIYFFFNTLRNVQVLERAKALVKVDDGGGGGEASRGLVETLASLGEELRDREQLRLELNRSYSQSEEFR